MGMRSGLGARFLPLLLAASSVCAQTEDYAAWGQWRVFSINTTATSGGANVTGTVAGYPLLVRLTAANASDVFAQAKPGGADLRFRRAVGFIPPGIIIADVFPTATPATQGGLAKPAAAQATQAAQAVDTDPQLPYEIAHWDSAGKTAEIWVLVDTIFGNRSGQYIAMHWGKSDAVSRSNPAAVFDSSKGLVSVWHMGGSNPTANRSNAVAGGNPAIPSGLNVATGFPSRNGVIGRADTLRGGTTGSARADDDHFNLGSGYANFSAGMTMSLWIKPATPSTTAWNVFYAFGNGAPGDNLTIGRMGNTTNMFSQIYNGTSDGGRMEMSNILTYNQWQLVTFAVQGDMQMLYHNGIISALGSQSQVLIPNVTRTMAYLGRSLYPDPNAAAAFDEVRLYKVRRAQDAIKLDYETQKPASTVLAVVAPPNPPGLQSPSANLTDVPVYTTLSWGGAAGNGTLFRVQLSTDSNFTAPLVNATTASFSHAVGPLSFLTNYYWRARTENIAGTGAWTAARRFTTAAEPGEIGITVLSSPAAFATNTALSPTLSWNHANGATSYRVQLSSSPTFASFVTNDSVTALSRAVGPLAGSTEYYWRVRGLHNTLGMGPWSEMRAFTTVATIPAAPYLLLPEGFSIGISTIPTLSWEGVTGATSYHVQVSTGSGFATYVLRDSTLTGTSRSIGSPSGTGQLAAFTDYYWKVRAKNSAGVGDWSTIRKFTTGQAVALSSSPRPSPLFAAPVRLASGTWLRFGLPRGERVSVRLLDARGRRAAVVWDGPVEAGLHSLRLPPSTAVRVLEFRAGGYRRTMLVGP
jgi:hypothetical protein